MGTAKLAFGAALGSATALVALSVAAGKGPEVRIAQLQCGGDPEVVVVENRGDAAADLAGWRLESDPPDRQRFDLSVLGEIQPGESHPIQSGPSAGGVFKWGLQFIYRDDDPTDYARIVDVAGATVDQVNCSAPAAQPSPTPSPAAGVPNGGGPPQPSGDVPVAAVVALIGGSVVAAGLASMAAPWLRPRPSLVAAPAARRSLRDRSMPSPRSRRPLSASLGLALVGVIAAVVIELVFNRRRRA